MLAAEGEQPADCFDIIHAVMAGGGAEWGGSTSVYRFEQVLLKCQKRLMTCVYRYDKRQAELCKCDKFECRC